MEEFTSTRFGTRRTFVSSRTSGLHALKQPEMNVAVLRPRGKLTDSVLHFGAAPTRIIVEFPNGYAPPAQGSTVSRDEARPLEITHVQKQEDGQLNVFAREIMQ